VVSLQALKSFLRANTSKDDKQFEDKGLGQISSLKQSEIIFPYLRKYEALTKKLQDNLERGQNGLPLLSLLVANIV
jgi:hypothetical protein